jgi:hypothetical protein
MKRWLWILALLTVLAGAWAQQAIRGQSGDLGPGAQGAKLRLPGMDPPSQLPTPGSPAIPPSSQGAWNPALVPGMTGQVGAPHIALPPSNSVNINKDITITGDVGPWTILVMSYTTPRDNPSLDAAQMAREFVTEWSTNPTYAKFKLKAYVFNYGAEEKQKEYERVQKLRKEQLDALNQMGLKGTTMPIRVQTMRIDEHTAVLLGGFRDADAAMNVAKEIRKLPHPDITRVKVDRLLGATYVPDAKNRPGSVQDKVDLYVNPFTKAMPVRNPAAPKEQAGGMTPEEMKYLREINNKEPLSLLNTKRPVTLAVKQFNTQFKATTDAKDAESFLSQIVGMSGKKTGESKDHAYLNAHNLADGLRKAKLDAYVLHCQCCSYVTVGSYNSVQDPELVQMQRFLETYFQAEVFRCLDMFERPMPMKVPGFN